MSLNYLYPIVLVLSFNCCSAQKNNKKLDSASVKTEGTVRYYMGFDKRNFNSGSGALWNENIEAEKNRKKNSTTKLYNTQIKFVNNSDRNNTYTTYTDSSGKYKLSVKPGVYTVEVLNVSTNDLNNYDIETVEIIKTIKKYDLIFRCTPIYSPPSNNQNEELYPKSKIPIPKQSKNRD